MRLIEASYQGTNLESRTNRESYQPETVPEGPVTLLLRNWGPTSMMYVVFKPKFLNKKVPGPSRLGDHTWTVKVCKRMAQSLKEEPKGNSYP